MRSLSPAWGRVFDNWPAGVDPADPLYLIVAIPHDEAKALRHAEGIPGSARPVLIARVVYERCEVAPPAPVQLVSPPEPAPVQEVSPPPKAVPPPVVVAALKKRR